MIENLFLISKGIVDAFWLEPLIEIEILSIMFQMLVNYGKTMFGNLTFLFGLKGLIVLNIWQSTKKNA